MPKIGLSKNIDNPKIILITLTTELPSEKTLDQMIKAPSQLLLTAYLRVKLKLQPKIRKLK